MVTPATWTVGGKLPVLVLDLAGITPCEVCRRFLACPTTVVVVASATVLPILTHLAAQQRRVINAATARLYVASNWQFGFRIQLNRGNPGAKIVSARVAIWTVEAVGVPPVLLAALKLCGLRRTAFFATAYAGRQRPTEASFAPWVRRHGQLTRVSCGARVIIPTFAIGLAVPKFLAQNQSLDIEKTYHTHPVRLQCQSHLLT